MIFFHSFLLLILKKEEALFFDYTRIAREGNRYCLSGGRKGRKGENPLCQGTVLTT